MYRRPGRTSRRHYSPTTRSLLPFLFGRAASNLDDVDRIIGLDAPHDFIEKCRGILEGVLCDISIHLE